MEFHYKQQFSICQSCKYYKVTLTSLARNPSFCPVIGDHLGDTVVIHVDILISTVSMHDLELNPPHSGGFIPLNNDLGVIYVAFLYCLCNSLRQAYCCVLKINIQGI